MTFSGGQWSESHNLTFSRYDHTSWVRPDGAVLLIGGRVSPTTTEVLNSNGSTTQSFDLKYPRRWAAIHWIHTIYLLLKYFRNSCVIDEGDTFLIIGGGDSPYNKVSRYNASGWLEDLSNLTEGVIHR